MNYSLILVFIAVSLILWVAAYYYYRQGIHRWWFHSSNHQPRLAGSANTDKHLLLAFVDHFEPMYQRPTIDVERDRVDRWLNEYPKLVKSYQDSDGRYPQHTFFYPEEEYRKEHIDKLAQLCRQGYGEIEVHLHHDHDTENSLREKLTRFVRILHEDHGALPISPETGKPAYAFIHGNWCLDNSGFNGEGCGVNNELTILRETGCYVDMTFPSAPSPTQPTQTNSIYYATDDPEKPKSHDSGCEVNVGGSPKGDLMLIQGPLGLNWRWRRWGIFPRLDNSDIRSNSPGIAQRVDYWISRNICVRGRPEWIFVKLHTHGTQEHDEAALLGSAAKEMYEYIDAEYIKRKGWKVHYVSAREMYNIAKAAEAGKTGDPNQYRNYILQRPSFSPNSQDSGSQQRSGE
jgi:hypothetical protein